MRNYLCKMSNCNKRVYNSQRQKKYCIAIQLFISIFTIWILVLSMYFFLLSFLLLSKGINRKCQQIIRSQRGGDLPMTKCKGLHTRCNCDTVYLSQLRSYLGFNVIVVIAPHEHLHDILQNHSVVIKNIAVKIARMNSP